MAVLTLSVRKNYLAFRIPSLGHLELILNRKFLNAALLRLRFSSISATQSDSNPGANSNQIIFCAPPIMDLFCRWE
jgi:hypothetical protein